MSDLTFKQRLHEADLGRPFEYQGRTTGWLGKLIIATEGLGRDLCDRSPLAPTSGCRTNVF